MQSFYESLEKALNTYGQENNMDIYLQRANEPPMSTTALIRIDATFFDLTDSKGPQMEPFMETFQILYKGKQQPVQVTFYEEWDDSRLSD